MVVQALVALETQSATVLHGPWASCWPSQLQCAAVHLEPEMQDEGAKVKPAGAEGQAWTAAEAAGLELPRLELSDAETCERFHDVFHGSTGSEVPLS